MNIFIAASLLLAVPIALAYTPNYIRSSSTTETSRPPSALNYIEDSSNFQDGLASMHFIADDFLAQGELNRKNDQAIDVDEYGDNSIEAFQQVKTGKIAPVVIGSLPVVDDEVLKEAFTFLSASSTGPSGTSAFTFNFKQKVKADSVAAFVVKPSASFTC